MYLVVKLLGTFASEIEELEWINILEILYFINPMV